MAVPLASMNKSTAVIFFGILLIGLVISLFSLKQCRNQEVADAPGSAEVQPLASIPEPSGPKPEVTTPPVPEPEKPAVPAAPAVETPPAPAPVADKPAPGTFPTAEAALKAMTAALEQKSYEAFNGVVGEKAIDPSVRDGVKGLIEDPALALDASKPHVELSKAAGSSRWALNFQPATGEGVPRQLYVDLAEVPEVGLEVAKVGLPIQPLAAADETATTPGPAAAGPDPAGPGQRDALTVAHAFSEAVVKRDFRTARSLADPGAVTDERVAALMIAIEEGKFALRQERPLVVTLSRDDITWVLARVEGGGLASEFAVELGQIEGIWKVNGLTFSKVLSALSQAAGAGDVAYSPIVEDPAGGDSLVLYFEFDDAGLTPRTERQLAIVAEILGQSAERVIRINGHADAKGSDDYNIGLSDRRAESIRQALIGMGVKPEQVVTEAFGAAKPRKPNFLPDGSDNPSGRSQNRRAEVLLDF